MSAEMYPGILQFYLDRINACPAYGFRSGEQLLELVVRCASHDEMLTGDEFNTIINLAERTHYKMLEVNYNENW